MFHGPITKNSENPDDANPNRGHLARLQRYVKRTVINIQSFSSLADICDFCGQVPLYIQVLQTWLIAYTETLFVCQMKQADETIRG